MKNLTYLAIVLIAAFMISCGGGATKPAVVETDAIEVVEGDVKIADETCVPECTEACLATEAKCEKKGCPCEEGAVKPTEEGAVKPAEEVKK